MSVNQQISVFLWCGSNADIRWSRWEECNVGGTEKDVGHLVETDWAVRFNEMPGLFAVCNLEIGRL